MVQELIKSELSVAHSVLDSFMNDSACLASVEAGANVMIEAIKNGQKIISCGNGGSCCDAMHFAEELTGKYRQNREPIAAISISDPSHMTCVGNDYGYEEVFSRYLKAIGQSGDVLLAISTSGNSKNIIKAIEVAKLKGIKVVALTGNTGGQIGALADVEIRVPYNGFADRIQEVHIKIIHIFMLLIEKSIN